MTIQLPQTSAAALLAGQLGRKLAPFSLALLLLPFAGKLRKAGKRLSRTMTVLLIAGLCLAAAAGVSGCGGSMSKAPQAYTVTVTGTSNNLSSSTTVTLTVE
jgi:hypothetical protein